LVGGYPFHATAYVPANLMRVTLEVRAQADLEQYGPFEVTVSEALDIPPLRTSTAGAFPD
jgi:hypothetical protein